MTTLTIGANAAINSDDFEIRIDWPEAAGVLDCTAFALTASGKVPDDSAMIFFNQREGQDGAVCLIEVGRSSTRFAFDTSRIDEAIERVVVCVTPDGPPQTLRPFQGLRATLNGSGDDLVFEPELTLANEAALKLVEIYRRSGGWKLRAVAQGSNDGLAKLARSFGVDIEERSAAPVESSPEPAGPALDGSSPNKLSAVMEAYRSSGSKLRVSAQNVNDGVARLASSRGMPDAPKGGEDKSPPAASFDIPDFGVSETASASRGNRIAKPREKPKDVVNLDSQSVSHRWPSTGAESSGSIAAKLDWASRQGGTDGRPRELLLELGIHYELMDGRTGVLQRPDLDCLTLASGSLAIAQPVGDCETGRSIAATISGWGEIKAITLYAFIKGTPSWAAATVSLRVGSAGHKAVEVPLANGEEGCGCVALMSIGKFADGIRLERVMLFGEDQRSLDAELGWNLAWRKRGS